MRCSFSTVRTYAIDLHKFLFNALTCVGAPYIWGAKGLTQWTPAGLVDRAPWAFDCSGLVTYSLLNSSAEVGTFNPLDWRGTHGAKQLAEALSAHNVLRENLQLGDLCFFGNPGAITHVAIYIAKDCMLEAGGGDRNTKTLQDAERRNARVKVSNYMRRDLVCIRRLPKELTVTT